MNTLKCSCGTGDAALIWCYIHGYLIKPPTVHRKTETLQPVEVKARSKKEHAKSADAATHSLRSEQTGNSVQTLAANETIDSQVTQPQAEVFGTGLSVTVSEKTSPQGIDSTVVTGTVFALMPEVGLDHVESAESRHKGFVTDAPRRKRNPWRAYARPVGDVVQPVVRFVPDGPRPERARTFRQSPLHRVVYIPDYVKQAKIQEQGNRCVYCERAFGSPILHNGNVEILEPQAEHFTPRSASGRNVDSNLNYACHVCNRLKSDYLFETVQEVRAWLVAEWTHKEYATCPPLVPFKRSAVRSYN
jgi:5-methylcytosine-specific restriction endonuclease McrA